MTTDYSKNLDELSPEKQELLKLLLMEDADEENTFPLSFAQRRLWFIEQLGQGSYVYNICTGVRLEGRLDESALERSFNEIVRRHEALRTVFTVADKQPVQVVVAAADVKTPVVDLESVPEAKREAEVQRLLKEESQTPFDLTRGPLLRVKLLRLSTHEHVLLLTMHHIISDGWSMGILVREMMALYEAFAQGRPSPLAELPIQYADFVLWQQEWLQGEVLDKHLDYWKEQLGGAPAMLELPTDRPRPALNTYRGAKQSVALPAELSAALKALSEREGVTMFMTLLAAFKTLCHRYTGQSDIVVGTPIANRNRAETEALIGFFINTLVLRTDLSGNPTFAELLRRVREVALEAYAHQDVPFEKIVEELQPERSLSHTPLFQVMFVLQNAPMDTAQLSGLTLTPMPVDNRTSKFDLTLFLEETPHGLVGTLEYNTDIFEGESVQRMLAHYAQLLQEVVTNPQRRLRELELLGTGEREQILRTWNETHVEWADIEADYHDAATLHYLVERQVERTPDAIALSFADAHLSYKELNAQANQLAHYLRTLGVGPDVQVGVMIERSVEMVVALLAVLKAGGGYVPLDPSYPQERLSYMLADSRVPVLLTQTHLEERLAGGSVAHVLALDTMQEALSAQPTHNPSVALGGENLAYMIYTSGSTGQPKGVQIPHRALVNFLSAMRRQPGITERDTLLSVTTLSFDIAGLELYLPLLAGARLVIVSRETTIDGWALASELERCGATVMQATPATWKLLLDAQWVGRPDLKILCGGEALSGELAARLLSKGGELWNMYGPTETTIWSAVKRVVTAGEGTVELGRPIANTQLYVLDESMRPVPVGVAGELYIGGDGLARGYFRRADLSAERFVPDPFGKRAGARLYRTGDLVRYRAGGELEFLGRADHQVKVRGYRIELGEIEAMLREHEGVKEAVVMVREGEGAVKRLIGYVQQVAVEDGEGVSASELRAYLSTRLPEYMVPPTFVMLDEWPLTLNSKIDRRALPMPDALGAQAGKEYVAPRNEVERVLAEVWAEVLRVKQVGVNDNYFELGGDSIRSVSLLAIARERGVSFSLQQIFQHQTIAELAKELEVNGTDEAAPTVVEPFGLITAEDRGRMPEGLEDAYPLTMLQAGMLFHIEYSPDSAVYHNVGSYHLRARFDAGALATALRQLIDAHPVLRTSFHLTSYSEPLQLVHRDVRVPLQVEDLRALSGEEQEQLIAAAIETEKSLKFDSSQPPLLRLRVQRRTDETFQFTLTEHHAILDGWSAASLLSELFKRYFAVLQGDGAGVSGPPLRGTFRDFVALEREILQSEEAREFWREKLSDSTVALIPRWPKPVEDGEAARLIHVELPVSKEVSAGLKSLAQAAGVPLKSVLLASYLRVMSLVSAQQDVVTGIVSHGRPEGADGERVLGLYLNTLPLRLKLQGGTWLELARETFEAERELLPYRRYPMAQIQNEQGHALYESFFNFVNFHVYEGLQSAGEVELLGGTSFSDTNYTLSAEFSLDEDSAKLTLLLSGSAVELGREQLTAIRDYFAETLAAMSSAPSSRYESASLLPAHEQQQTLVEWNQTRRDYPTGTCLHQLFEQQVERTPSALALIAADERLTYSELNERANRLAHHLQALGVTAETRVGIMQERTASLLVSLLAVHKAGGAYVPLDPAYPQERLMFMLEDADVKVLLTTEQLAAQLAERANSTRSTPAISTEVVAVDAIAKTLAEQPITNPLSEVEAANLSHVIYTSGSTGIPKGVAISHSSSSTLVQWALEEFTPEQLAGVLASTSINFDLSVFELFVPLSCGGTVLLVENALALPEMADKEQVTLINTVPSAISELVRMGGLPESLQVVNLAGEPLMRGLVQRIYEQPHVRHVVNLYGPSEDTTYSTCGWVSRDINQPVTIGRPLANTQCYLLDSWMQPVPLGVTGELYIGGDGLARGYLGRPELTAEKFVPNPFGASAGTRLYRTGDVARYLPDGEIEFLGRGDHQIKLRGFRIELGEIETVLTTHPSVRYCAVMVREDVEGDKRLVAYVVGEEGSALAASELRSLIKQKLPEYMIPSVFMLMDEMPLTPNGKIDRKRLPAPEQTRDTLEAEFAAPRTAVEEVLAGIWSQVLGVERVGVRDDFFELGGHSLLATQIISRVREAFRVEIPLRSLFSAPTVGGLARSVEAAMRGESGAATPPLVALGRDGELPLSFAQQRLWFIDQVRSGSSAFNIAEAIRLRGPLSVGALEQTLNEVVRRHEVLRTAFPSDEGHARQIITPEMKLELPLVDLTKMAEAVRESEALRLAEQEAQKPFDLARGPLVRATLVRLGAEDHAVLFTMHHIISDAWSMGVLVREVAALYEAFLRNEPSPLAELPVQYADFARWQRERLRGETLDAHLAYWKEQLAGAPAVLEMPTDRPRPAEPTFTGGRYSLAFDEALTASLKTLSQQEGGTMFMTLLAAYQILLHHYSGKDDILVGTDVANRNRFELEQLIGFFINQLVLRGKVSMGATFREMLSEVRDVTLGAYAYQDLPFDRLVDGLKVERRSQYSPLFQVKLVFQNAPLPPLELPQLEIASMGINSGMSRFDLQLTLWEEAGRLGGWFEYNADLFDAATINRLGEDLQSILRAATAQPDILVGELDRLLDEAARQRDAARKEESKAALSQKFKSVRRKSIGVPEGRR